MSAVFVPAVAFASATNVTTPVVGFSVKVPSPAMVTTLSASQAAGFDPGAMRHVALAPLVCSCVPVASPDVPVIVVNVAVPPGITALVSGVAIGAGGGVTVGVIVASSLRPSVSVA